MARGIYPIGSYTSLVDGAGSIAAFIDQYQKIENNLYVLGYLREWIKEDLSSEEIQAECLYKANAQLSWDIDVPYVGGLERKKIRLVIDELRSEFGVTAWQWSADYLTAGNVLLNNHIDEARRALGLIFSRGMAIKTGVDYSVAYSCQSGDCYDWGYAPIVAPQACQGPYCFFYQFCSTNPADGCFDDRWWDIHRSPIFKFTGSSGAAGRESILFFTTGFLEGCRGENYEAPAGGVQLCEVMTIDDESTDEAVFNSFSAIATFPASVDCGTTGESGSLKYHKVNHTSSTQHYGLKCQNESINSKAAIVCACPPNNDNSAYFEMQGSGGCEYLLGHGGAYLWQPETVNPY